MSLRQQVADLVEELGRASGEDLVAHFPEHTKDQIFQALQNAKWCGRIKIIEPSRGKGPRGGRTAAVYGPVTEFDEPKPKPEPACVDRPVSSVWELGRARAAMSRSQLDALLCFNLARASRVQ